MFVLGLCGTAFGSSTSSPDFTIRSSEARGAADKTIRVESPTPKDAFSILQDVLPLLIDPRAPGSGAETEASPFLPPGHGGTPPGQGGTPPGQTTPPGHGGTPPGQAGTAPGQGGGPPPGHRDKR